jgi:hypothetical protein
MDLLLETTLPRHRRRIDGEERRLGETSPTSVVFLFLATGQDFIFPIVLSKNGGN